MDFTKEASFLSFSTYLSLSFYTFAVRELTLLSLIFLFWLTVLLKTAIFCSSYSSLPWDWCRSSFYNFGMNRDASLLGQGFWGLGLRNSAVLLLGSVWRLSLLTDEQLVGADVCSESKGAVQMLGELREGCSLAVFLGWCWGWKLICLGWVIYQISLCQHPSRILPQISTKQLLTKQISKGIKSRQKALEPSFHSVLQRSVCFLKSETWVLVLGKTWELLFQTCQSQSQCWQEQLFSVLVFSDLPLTMLKSSSPFFSGFRIRQSQSYVLVLNILPLLALCVLLCPSTIFFVILPLTYPIDLIMSILPQSLLSLEASLLPVCLDMFTWQVFLLTMLFRSSPFSKAYFFYSQAALLWLSASFQSPTRAPAFSSAISF